ncbi:MAG: sulfur carrier protein ThiS [Planctomycetota bacterium]
MDIILNGEKKQVHEGLNIAELLTVLNIKTEQVAVELNLAIINKNYYENKILENEDCVEIISFVGGG